VATLGTVTSKIAFDGEEEKKFEKHIFRQIVRFTFLFPSYLALQLSSD
jgi:hypothetical protein